MRKTTEQFIQQSRAIHGDRYDYSNFEYVNNKTPGKITCTQHGEFFKTPVSHVQKGRGCPRCTDGYYEKLTTEEYIKRCQEIHGEKYDYSLTKYSGVFAKVDIICSEHGRFTQTARDHSRGKGCTKCNGGVSYDTVEFVKKTKETHGNRYDYSKVDYINKDIPVVIICSIHGEFQQRPGVHMLGGGCPQCASNSKVSEEEFINRSKEIHNDFYDYSKVKLKNTSKPIEIICPKHGEFFQIPSVHHKGHGCPKCAVEHVSTKFTYSFDWFEKKALKVHDGRYSYVKDSYTNTNGKVIIICPKHGEFTQRVDGHLYAKYGCPSCSHIRSRSENEMVDYLSSIYNGEIQQGNRGIISPYELDIVIPEKRLAIEYCGLRWHGEVFGNKGKKYHLKKLNAANEAGYRLITIFEDEWKNKQHIVKYLLSGIIGKGERGIYARKTKVEEITWKYAKGFLAQYHLQGSGTSGFVRYGAFYEEQLIAIMTFSKGRIALNSGNKSIHEMLRFATDGRHHPGIGSKLLNRFIEEYNPREIISYADRRWFTGDMYLKLGFEEVGYTPPSYWYFKNPDIIRYHRYNFRKQIVIEKMGGDSTLTEWQNMKNMSWDRIWDCGTVKYIYKASGER